MSEAGYAAAAGRHGGGVCDQFFPPGPLFDPPPTPQPQAVQPPDHSRNLSLIRTIMNNPNQR